MHFLEHYISWPDLKKMYKFLVLLAKSIIFWHNIKHTKHVRNKLSYLLTYLLTYLLHGAESFLRS